MIYIISLLFVIMLSLSGMYSGVYPVVSILMSIVLALGLLDRQARVTFPVTLAGVIIILIGDAFLRMDFFSLRIQENFQLLLPSLVLPVGILLSRIAMLRNLTREWRKKLSHIHGLFIIVAPLQAYIVVISPLSPVTTLVQMVLPLLLYILSTNGKTRNLTLFFLTYTSFFVGLYSYFNVIGSTSFIIPTITELLLILSPVIILSIYSRYHTIIQEYISIMDSYLTIERAGKVFTILAIGMFVVNILVAIIFPSYIQRVWGSVTQPSIEKRLKQSPEQTVFTYLTALKEQRFNDAFSSLSQENNISTDIQEFIQIVHATDVSQGNIQDISVDTNSGQSENSVRMQITRERGKQKMLFETEQKGQFWKITNISYY